MLDAAGILHIDAGLDNSQIMQIAKYLQENLYAVRGVEVDTGEGVVSSALFSLLASIKKSNKEIRITLLDDHKVHRMGSLGDVRLIMKD